VTALARERKRQQAVTLSGPSEWRYVHELNVTALAQERKRQQAVTLSGPGEWRHVHELNVTTSFEELSYGVRNIGYKASAGL